jgi:hypothetical protein
VYNKVSVSQDDSGLYQVNAFQDEDENGSLQNGIRPVPESPAVVTAVSRTTPATS